MKSFLAVVAVSLCLFSAIAAENTVGWNLPVNWADDVAYESASGYCLIVGDELISRAGAGGKVGDPDVPYFRVNLDMPHPGTFKGLTYQVDWEPVDLGGLLPIPVAQPVPTSEQVVLPAPGAAYQTVYPVSPAQAESIIILNGSRKVPVTISPFKWDGPSQTLYKATSLTVTATFDVPDVDATSSSRQKRTLSVPSDATGTARLQSVSADYGDDTTADYLILSPPKFLNLWKTYADFRKTTEVGKNHTFAIKSTAAIYEEYADVGGDDAFKIHRYLEHLYSLGKIKYILLGSAPAKYSYNPETMVPSRYLVVGSSLGQVSDEYYGCMHRSPIDASGNEQGVEVWDYDGDGTYMGHKNANGSYSCDSADKIDWTQEIVVFRFPLMEEVVETKNGVKVVLTASEIMDNFIAKTRLIEGEDFAGRYSATLVGSSAFSSSSYSKASRPEHQNSVVDERQFFDGLLNVFDPQHPRNASDSEFQPRDRNWEFFTYLRGNKHEDNVAHNSSYYAPFVFADIYRTSADVLDVVAHGWARGAEPVNSTDAFFSTGYHVVYCAAVPCDTGMMDYCPGGSYGITNCVCMGEAPILAPQGGALASFNNTRLGWSATCATSGNNGKGQHSHRMDWLILRAMSGIHNKLGTDSTAGDGSSEPMDAGTALMFAKNNFNAGYYASAAWGLSGLEVTGQGDPLARFSSQHARVWKSDAANTNWNGTDKNWTIPGKNDSYVSDYSTDLSADLTGKGSVTFNVQTNLASAGLFVTQDAGATLTLSGDAKYRVTRETVITNGNLCWSAAGGTGRNGITFVGNRGNLTLPGDRPRYFGEKFTNVGDILVSGGNVTIDTPRNAQYGAGKSVDFASLAFIGDRPLDAGDRPSTNNIFRTRKASFLPENFTIPVVNSELILQVTDNPKLAATNATLQVQINPQYESCYFARPIYLNNSTIVGEYVNFAFGPAAGTGFDLYVKGACKIAGSVPIKLNGELRIHFEDSDASLEIENALTDGTVAGGLSPLGAGTLKLTGAQSFTGALTISEGQTLECEVENAVKSSICVENGGTLKLAKIPQTILTDLTVKSGAALYLPAPTYPGTYKIVDATTTTLTIETGAKVYDANGNEMTGEVTQGHFVLAANQLVWQTSGATWNKAADNLAWKTAAGVASAYADNSPLTFPDLTGTDPAVSVLVGTDVAPGFVDFRNETSRYVFSAAEGQTPTITFNSLIANTPVTFNVPVTVPGGIMATGSASVFGDVVTPKVEIAAGASVRATGNVQIPSQKMKKLRFEFSATRTDGNRAAINELRLFNASGRFYLPEGTVIKDIAGQTITVQAGTQGSEGQVVTGNVGDEALSALVDGTLTGGNKWWASKSASPTWFEITFPESVDPITGYSIRTADQEARDPKDWKVYAGFDEDRLSLVATESGRTHNARRDWMKSGATVNDRFPIGDMAGLALVRADGALVLDGSWCADLDLKADAVLKVVGTSSLTATSGTLYLPDTGAVKVDLSGASASSEAFPILKGYNITAEQFGKFTCVTDTAMLLLKDGDIYAATANVMVPPYTATVTGNTNWNTLSFTDSNATTFTWGAANIKASGSVTLNVTGDSVVTMDAVGTIAALTITGSKALTIAAADGVTPLAPSVIDDSAHTGTLTWNLPIGSAAVKAGANTVINGGSAGSGLLTVGANKKITLGEGVTFANRTIDSAAWVRFAGAREDVVLADWTPATYSFENATLAGSFLLPGHTIKSVEGDYVKLVGSGSNYYARSLINFDISGGTVEIEPNGETTWFGRTATTGGAAATTFRMMGGTFRCLADGTGNGAGLLLGYEGGDEAGNEITLDISGGTFEVPNSFLNFGTPTIVNLTGSGVLRAKGFVSSMSPTTLTLGTRTGTNTCRVEVGALGFAASAASKITMYENTAIVGKEEGASFSGSLMMYAANRNTTDSKFYLGAAEGASLTLNNVLYSRYSDDTGTFYNGNEGIVFGRTDLTGTIVVGDATSLPDKWKLAGGTVNLGAVRASAASVLSAQPTTGKIVVEVSYDEYSSGAAVEILNCGSWSDSLAESALRGFITIRAEDGAGVYSEVTTGTLKSMGGIINFLPEGSSGYVFPISASVTGDANWTDLTWRDRNGILYTNDWLGVTSVELVNEAGTYTVTMNRDVTVPRLATRVTSGKSLSLTTDGTHALTITGKLDDSTSSGTTSLDIALGAGVTIAAGKALQLKGATDATTPHGTLTIGAGSVATIVDGYWNGAVQMADATAKLVYKSASTLSSVPSSQGGATVGYVEYYAPMTTDAAIFGSADAKSADGLFYFREGTDLTTSRFVTGKGNGTVQTIFQAKNASITVTGDQGADSTNPSLLLASDLGSSVTYYVLGGTFISDNAPLVLGGQGSANFMFYRTGDCYRLKGVTTNGKDNKSSFTHGSGTLEIGSDGIDIVSSIRDEKPVFFPFNWSGTIVARTNTTIRVPGGIGVNYSGMFEPAAGATIRVESPLEHAYLRTCYGIYAQGAGTVEIAQEQTQGIPFYAKSGTLKLTRPGLLNESSVNFSGGRVAVVITRDQALTAGSKYKLYKTSATQATVAAQTDVLISETGGIANGSLTVENGYAYFAPSAITGLRATTADATGDWEGLAWKDANGTTVDAGVWNSVIGTATLTNTGDTDLTFAGTAAVTTLTIANSGNLKVSGTGAMTVTTLDDSSSTGRTELGSCFAFNDVKAGADTVLTDAGSGTLTIAAGKQATIPGWTTLANVTGAGTVVLDAGAKETAIAWGSGQTSGVSGTNILARGTWTHTTTATYPRDREVLVKGADAVMKFMSVTDVSGYAGYSNALTLEDGGTWLVNMRDTFSRPLHLVNGGHVKMSADASNGSRALDFFSTSAKIYVRGETPSTIGGQAADEASLNGSGIINIRRSNFTVDVAEEATLKVYSRWNTGDNSGGSFIKSGAGVWEQYRESGNTLPFTISAGTLRLVNAGSVTTGAMTNDGTLELNIGEGVTRVFANTVTGTGAFVKTGAGTLAFGTARPTYAINVVGGKLSFTLTAEEKASGDWIPLYTDATGTSRLQWVVYDTDGTTAANVSDTKVENGVVYVKVEQYRMPITLNVTSAQTKDWVNADWEDASGTHIDSAAWEGLLANPDLSLAINAYQPLTLNVNTNVTATSVTISGTGGVLFNPVEGHTLTAPIRGTGTIVSDSVWPSFVGMTDATNWKGCVKLTGTLAMTNTDFTAFGNANSSIEIAGAVTGGEIVVNMPNVIIAAGYTCTATNGLKVLDGAKLTVTPGTTPITGVASFAAGATLNILADGSEESYTISTAALSIDDAAILQFNGTTVNRAFWKTNGGVLVPRPEEVTATVAGTPITTDCNGRDLVVTGTADGFVTVGTALSPKTMVAQGETLVLKYSDGGLLTVAEGLTANVAVQIDASGMNGTELAKNAVAGAPYSCWLVKGAVTGTVTVEGLPTVPTGYAVASEVLPLMGVRLVVTANPAARFGSVSINFAGGRDNVWDSTDSHVSDNGYAEQRHGAHSILGSEWIDLTTQNGTYATNVVTVKISGVNNPYTTGRTGSARILFGYADDSGHPKMEISGIPYEKYRVLVYRATDTTGTNYSSVKIGATENDAVYYNGPTADSLSGGWTVPNTTQVVWGDSDGNDVKEGVNYVVSDVLTGGTAYIYSQKHAGRAGVAAIQIVKVGEIYEGALEYEEKTLATKLSYVLPASVTTQAFDYVYHPLGTDDGNWATASNWASVVVKQQRDGSIVTNYTAYTGSTAPALAGGTYVPVVFDGCTVAAATVEGWIAQYGLFNGASVTITRLTKLQGNDVQKFIAVDATSKLTIVNDIYQSNSNGSVDYHVAAPSGIVYQTAYANSTGLTVNYYLEGEGSVVYEKGFTAGTHTLKAATIELGDAAQAGKKVVKKYLVVGSGTVGTGDVVVTCVPGGSGSQGTASPTATASDAALTGGEDVGTYFVSKDSVGTYVEWVAYGANGVFYTDEEKGVTYDITAAFTNAVDGSWVLDGTKSVTITVPGGEAEIIPVKPVLSTIANDADVSAVPFVVEDGKSVVGVKTIPGLTYELVRFTDLRLRAASSTVVASGTANGARMKLVDDKSDRPSDKAFYIIRVSR